MILIYFVKRNIVYFTLGSYLKCGCMSKLARFLQYIVYAQLFCSNSNQEIINAALPRRLA
jgi:hypothetical protein